MAGEIAYAKVGGPPDDWQRLQVRDLANGGLLDRVVEVNATEGWAIVHETPLRHDPKTGKAATKKIDGKFLIERQP